MNPAPIYRERLSMLAALLDKLPPERFDYGVWAGRSWKGLPDLSCGTTACALGWATTIPAFRELGLRLVKDPGFPYPTIEGFVSPDDDASVDYISSAEHALEAARVVFGLEVAEAQLLFFPEGADDYKRWNDDTSEREFDPEYIDLETGRLLHPPHGLTDEATPKQVARLIRDFMDGKVEP